MSHQPAEHHGGVEHHGTPVHISPNSMYVGVFLALILLTGITAWVSFYNFGFLNDVVALGIAFTKASLVVLFFMHLKYGTRLNKVVIVAALVWLSLLLGMTMIDYASRNVVDIDPDAVTGPYDDFEADEVERKLLQGGEHGSGEHSQPAH